MPRQARRRKRALNVTYNVKNLGYDLTTAFREFVTRADAQPSKIIDKPRLGRPGLKERKAGRGVGDAFHPAQVDGGFAVGTSSFNHEKSLRFLSCATA